ncbi:unnamed protein product [Phytomonas sp. Hart1]|nr:unnamed protein product [Phytomonas sp. Hart1]|eukprot:CCW71111.1 unnamed protein product [Phytomonas sp. isolate Hart1]
MEEIQRACAVAAEKVLVEENSPRDSIYQRLIEEREARKGGQGVIVPAKRRATSAGVEDKKIEEEWVFVSLLAKLTRQVVGNCSDWEWNHIFLKNFFLPHETFANSEDAQQISIMRKTGTLNGEEFSVPLNFYHSEAKKITNDFNL